MKTIKTHFNGWRVDLQIEFVLWDKNLRVQGLGLEKQVDFHCLVRQGWFLEALGKLGKKDHEVRFTIQLWWPTNVLSFASAQYFIVSFSNTTLNENPSETRLYIAFLHLQYLALLKGGLSTRNMDNFLYNSQA